MKYILLFCFVISSAFAQTFVSQETVTNFKFQGSLIKEGTSDKGAMIIRKLSDQYEVILALQVKDFKFATNDQRREFNETHMDSQLYPQIRITGKLTDNVDLTQDGVYIVTFNGRFTMKKNPVPADFKMKIEVRGNEMMVGFEKEVDLKTYRVAYASEGSAIGRFADFIFTGKLVRTH